MNLFRELRQNPVFLREAGFEFTPRVLGVSSGLAKVALVAGLMIFLVLFTASQAGRFQNVYFAMAMCATLLSPILALIVMISAPRGIRMRGGVSSIANLMVSPLSPKIVAQGMLLGQGFPVIIGGVCYSIFGAALLAMTNPSRSEHPEWNLIFGVILMFAGPLFVDLFVEGFKAGMRREGFAAFAVMRYLVTIALYAVFPAVTQFASVKMDFGYRRGVETANMLFYSLTSLALLFALLRAYYCWRDLLATTDELATACEAYWERGDAS
jgi:hypothetical protein